MAEPEPTGAVKVEGAEEPKQVVRFHFIKSNQFRVIHADGALGGPAPGGNTIVVNFYSERAPIPLVTTYELDENGMATKEIERVGRDGPVREVEVSVVVSLNTAKNLIDWLKATLEQTEKQLKEYAERTT